MGVPSFNRDQCVGVNLEWVYFYHIKYLLISLQDLDHLCLLNAPCSFPPWRANLLTRRRQLWVVSYLVSSNFHKCSSNLDFRLLHCHTEMSNVYRSCESVQFCQSLMFQLHAAGFQFSSSSQWIMEQSVLSEIFWHKDKGQITSTRSSIPFQTLPEAQRTQGIDSLTWVISPAKKNASRWQH